MIYLDQLKKIKEEIAEYRDTLGDELREMPEGSLFIRREKENNRNYCYCRVAKGGNRKKEHRYGISNDQEMIKKLVRKRYLEEAVEKIDVDLGLLDKAIKSYQPFDEVTVMDGVRSAYRGLDESTFNYQTRADEWAKQHEPIKGFYENDLRSLDTRGTQVRSKSELYICSRLDHYKIPYKYEAPITIPDLSYVPDFTIKRRRDNQVIYWEHLGRVNDRKYMLDYQKKFDDYERYGIVPWKNLIITYDYENGGINAKLIDAMIEAWLL